MPGTMSKEDAPSRGASLTFTIDNILNLKQRGGKELEKRGGKKYTGGLLGWDVRRRNDSPPEETGKEDFTNTAWKLNIPFRFMRL